jgi:CheY-like chemotaxis protein/HPt (histidine-containing phosphotransfer) domain-containing protein
MKRTLLLIDDDAISREVLAVLLAPFDIACFPAASGEAALELLRNSATMPDGILVDAQLPALSGTELIAALRSAIVAPILLISASAVEDGVLTAADAFLRKPLDPKAILAALDAAIVTRAAKAPTNSAPKVQAAEAEPSATANAAPETEHDFAPWPVIDSEILAKFCSRLKPVELRVMYQALADDCAQRMSVLRDAMRAEDASQVRATAHAIKGGCAMLGVTAARNAAASLEVAETAEHWQRDCEALGEALRALQTMLADALF